jgi:serine protease Do
MLRLSRLHFVLFALSTSALSASALGQPKAAPPAPKVVATGDAKKLGETFAAVAEKVSPSVVQIDVTVVKDESDPLRWFKADGVKRGVGSGIVYAADGAIVTNNHVIEDARAIQVRLKDGRLFSAKVVGRDPGTDLAVLRIDAKGLPAATLGDVDGSRVGEWVVAIGSPFGLGHTVTVGVLSAKGRGGVGVNAVEDYLQTDASINPGNSGGPLVSLDGKVLGINTMMVSRGNGIGLAVPSGIVKRVADEILKVGRVDRAWLGIGLQDLTPQLAAEIAGAPTTGGALVNAVTKGAPASKANLQAGDVITTVGGKAIRDAQDVLREVFVRRAGEELKLDVVRAGKKYQTKVVLESRGDAAPPPLPVERPSSSPSGLGLGVKDGTDPDTRSTVALVASVAADSIADRAGVRVGDLVLEADGAAMPNSTQVQTAATDGRVLLRLKRGAAIFYVALKK